jgi:MFS family permease
VSDRPSPVAALRYRNFRLLWVGQLVSMSGSLMQSAAILWHVALIAPPGHKAIALGMVGLVRVLPIVGFSLLSGVVADAYDRRRVMLITQTLMAALAVVLAVLTMGGLRTPWPIYVVAALSSAAGAFDGPARHALIPNLVPREHLANAISLNTIMFQIAAVAGPSAGGIIIATGGVAAAYWINAASFLFVIGALVMMRDVRGKGGDASVPHPPGELSLKAALDGLRFVFAQPLIRSSMLLDFFATFFSSATALLPIFAQDILGVGAHGYGWLYAAPSVGALAAGAAMVPLVDRIDRRGVVLLWAVAGYGLATVAFGASRSFWLMFACLVISGATDSVSTVFRNVIRQMETPDHLRGRMVGINMAFFMGGPQLGELEAGLVANWWGAPFSVISGGLGCLLVTGWIAARTPALRAYHR